MPANIDLGLGDLWDSEWKLVEQAAKGEVAPYQSGDAEADKQTHGRNWGDERAIRAKVIYALVTGGNPDWPVHAKGIVIWGARIAGLLDFTGTEIGCPLAFGGCYFENEVVLEAASSRFLAFSSSYLDLVSHRA